MSDQQRRQACCLTCSNAAKVGSYYCTPCNEKMMARMDRARLVDDLDRRIGDVPDGAVHTVLRGIMDLLRDIP
jgi:hypothetical protein